MPLYDYKCRDCGHVFEAIERSTVVAKPCPKCPGKWVTLLGKDKEHLPAWAFRQLSCPGGIRAHGANGGMVLSEAQMKKIKEPVWQDEKTGAITSVH